MSKKNEFGVGIIILTLGFGLWFMKQRRDDEMFLSKSATEDQAKRERWAKRFKGGGAVGDDDDDNPPDLPQFYALPPVFADEDERSPSNFEKILERWRIENQK